MYIPIYDKNVIEYISDKYGIDKTVFKDNYVKLYYEGCLAYECLWTGKDIVVYLHPDLVNLFNDLAEEFEIVYEDTDNYVEEVDDEFI